MGIQLTEGVQHIHTVLNQVHCDIKPENIFIKNENQFIIGDLGSSINMKGVKGVTNNVTIKNIMGTEPYCSPEVIRGTYNECTKELDNWALGITLYQAFE